MQAASPEPGRCSVRLTRRYRATPAEVWDTLIEPDSMARWLARPRSMELSPGGALELEFPDGGVVAAVVRAVEPGRLLELNWRYGTEDPSVVRFELTSDGDGTLLVLDHRRIEARVGMLAIARWRRAVTRFEAVVGG